MRLFDFLKRLFSRHDPHPQQNSAPKKSDFSILAVAVPLLCGNEIQNTANATATIIDPNKGLLLTAKHAVEGCTKFMFRYEGTWFLADAIYTDPENDLALLATDPAALKGAPKLSWDAGVLDNERVFVHGYVRKFSDANEVFKLKNIAGKITGASEEWGWEITQDTKDSESHEGMSGSPVLDQDNKLVGIYTHHGRSFLYAACWNGALLEKIEQYSPAQT